MKIFFEGTEYETELLEKNLHKNFFAPSSTLSLSKVEYVGYYNNRKMKEPVIILPKVFIDKDHKAFGLYDPTLFTRETNDYQQQLKADGLDEIIFELSTWLYRAIVTFKQRHETTQIGYTEACDILMSNIGISENTELDIILSLLRFHKENKQLFTYVAKINSTGRKIDWKKTISKKNPIIQSNTPIYTKTLAKSKVVNFDEELIIIFYSTLHHLRQHYGFSISFNENYTLIKGNDFERFKRKATQRLKSIKNKYFNDKFKVLWKLLYSYFSHSNQSKHSAQKNEEVLIVKNFNIVFEDMIDYLISDSSEIIPKHFKDQKDGKRVDHIYKDKSLILNDDIYYIGDSKYYKPSTAIGTESTAKQFTYAKNVIQYNIDLFNKGETKCKAQQNIKYRDDLTEGYNITPNFFISAFVDKKFNFHDDGLKSDSENETILQYHYNNRLFDRDTLIVQKYDINFLFVLSAYISKSSLNRELFKTRARRKFKEKMVSYCNKTYKFYTLTPKDKITLEDFVNKHFKLLNGKIYKPTQMKQSIIFATSNSSKLVLEVISTDCIINDYHLLV